MQTLNDVKNLKLSSAAESAAAPVRVCFLIDDLAAAGTESQLLALIHRLDRSRVQPYLCILRGEGRASRSLEPDDCPVARLGVGSLCRPTTLIKAMRFIQFLRRERIDVIQAYFADSGYFGLPSAWLAGAPHRLRTRNNLGHWLTPLHRRLGRLLNFVATGTVVNCGAAKDALIAAEGSRVKTVTILENGVDHEPFLNIPPLRGQLSTMGAAANLRFVKGLDLLLDAVTRLVGDHPDLVCRIAGEGDMRGALETSARQRGLTDRFQLLGSVENVPGFLAGIDVAVLPSRSEGMSNALLEYMAAGRAIVATTVGAASELIDDGVHGLLVPPNDSGRLTAALDCLLKNPALARRFGEAARRRVRERYSRAAMVERFTDFYERLIAK